MTERRFEDVMDELERVVAQLAAGALGVEAATELFERAEQLRAEAEARLEQVRQRIAGLAPPDDAAP